MEGNAFLYIWKKSRFHLIDGMGGKEESLFYMLAEMDVGGKCHFVDRESTSGMISLHGGELTGHSIPR